MKTIEEMISVMQAYAKGKKIEARLSNGLNGPWEESKVPTWNWFNCDYRIKPEPKCRPYANAKECLKDVQTHGGWIKDRNHEAYYTITDVGNSGCRFNGRYSMYQDLFLYYDWADDLTPCGVIEEE